MWSFGRRESNGCLVPIPLVMHLNQTGSVELHLRCVEDGRFFTWAFEKMKIGDKLSAMGALGNFWMRSVTEKVIAV